MASLLYYFRANDGGDRISRSPQYTFKQVALLLIILFSCSSCYSVRIINARSAPEPDPLNMCDGFYKGKMVHKLDTTIKLKLVEGEFTLNEKKCPSEGFYSYEYRTTFWGLIINTITFGKVSKVHVKYVCTKEDN